MQSTAPRDADRMPARIRPLKRALILPCCHASGRSLVPPSHCESSHPENMEQIFFVVRIIQCPLAPQFISCVWVLELDRWKFRLAVGFILSSSSFRPQDGKVGRQGALLSRTILLYFGTISRGNGNGMGRGPPGRMGQKEF